MNGHKNIKIRHLSLLILNLRTRWGGGQSERPGRFTAGKSPRIPQYRRLGGPQGGFRLSGRQNRLPLGYEPRTVQPVASRYAAYAIPDPTLMRDGGGALEESEKVMV